MRNVSKVVGVGVGMDSREHRREINWELFVFVGFTVHALIQTIRKHISMEWCISSSVIWSFFFLFSSYVTHFLCPSVGALSDSVS